MTDVHDMQLHSKVILFGPHTCHGLISMLTVSTASVDITPSRAMPLAGYANRGGVFERVDDRLSAELILLEGDDGQPVLIAGIDCLFIDTLFRETLAAGSELLPERLILVASHTHNAPALDRTIPALGAYDHNWTDEVIGRVAAAVHSLHRRAKRAPVTCSWAQRATTLAVSRRRPGFKIEYGQSFRERRFIGHRGIQLAPNPRRKVDATIRMIAMRDSMGVVRAVIWSFAAHPAFYPDNAAVSGDFPGAVRVAIKEQFGPQCAVLFFPGLAGSSIPAMQRAKAHNVPDFIRMFLPFNPHLPSFSHATFRDYVGRLSNLVCDTIASSLVVADISPSVHLRSKNIEPIFCAGPASKRPAPRLSIIALDLARELRILAFSGEMLDEWWPVLNEAAPVRGLVTAYSAGDATYIPPERVQREGGYEAQGFMASFGLAGCFTNGLDKLVAHTVSELLES